MLYQCVYFCLIRELGSHIWSSFWSYLSIEGFCCKTTLENTQSLNNTCFFTCDVPWRCSPFSEGERNIFPTLWLKEITVSLEQNSGSRPKFLEESV